jgi:hypothetical protein
MKVGGGAREGGWRKGGQEKRVKGKGERGLVWQR